MQLTSGDLNMATDYEHLSSWGKDAYLEISGKMITAGIRPEKFEGGVLKQHTLLGQWLIKELVRIPSFLPPSSLHQVPHTNS